MASQAVSALAARATAALKGKPELGASLCVCFGADGCVFVYPNNRVAVFGSRVAADCTLTLSLAELDAIEGGANVAWAVLSGAVQIEGDRGLAEKFGTLIRGAA